MTSRLRVLMVDDEAESDLAIPEGLRQCGIEMVTETLASQALPRLAADPGIDVVLLDLNFGQQSMQGEDVFAELRQCYPLLPVIILTSKDQLSLARDFERRGAAAYLNKSPAGIDVVELAAHIDRAWRAGALRRLLDRGRAPGARVMVAASTAMRRVVTEALRAAGGMAPLLISGECGTGKTSLARYIHENSRVSAGPLVTVDAASIPQERLEPELFGDTDHGGQPGMIHLANGGTLLLEEAGALGPALQTRILEVIETGECRPVATASPRSCSVRFLLTSTADPDGRPLVEIIDPSLYYRLSGTHIRLPALRERMEDIGQLAITFLHQAGGSTSGRPAIFTPAAAELLRSHSYPGNLWELRSVVEAAALRISGNTVEGGDLTFPAGGHPSPASLDYQQMALSILDGKKSIYYFELTVADRTTAYERNDYLELLGALIRIYRQRYARDPLLKDLAAAMAPSRPEDEANRWSAKLRRFRLRWKDVLDRTPA